MLRIFAKIRLLLTKVLTGNEAAVEAVRQVNPDVVAAYPITPSTKIPEKISQLVAQGQMQTEFVPVESEHSALSACVGASAAGARTFTGTASQGLALMHEVFWNAAGLRLPIVVADSCRALSAPLSIHGDHSDAYSVRDTGWLQFFAASPQEVYDTTLLAFPLGEKLQLPVIVCFDGFETSHLSTQVTILADSLAKKFVGQAPPRPNLLDFANPQTFGTHTSPNFYFEFRRQQNAIFTKASATIQKLTQQLSKISQRQIPSLVESYQTKDAKFVAICLGSIAGEIREAVTELRQKGHKVGVLRLKAFRPFPAQKILQALPKAQKVAICERTMPVGTVGGPLFCETAAILPKEISVFNFISGVGQRQFNTKSAKEIFQKLQRAKLPRLNFIGLRG